jgi:hypothetical protein
MAMDANTSRPKVCRISLCVIPLTVLWLFLAGWPALLLAQTAGTDSQVEALVETPDTAESLPLTTAQEQARQLATVLVGGKSHTAPAAERRTLLGVITAQPLRPGTRVILPIFTGQGVEGRLVSGEQTFTSPVEEEGTTVQEDARRPLFLPAAKTALSFELLVE